jgi:polyphosphate kinase
MSRRTATAGSLTERSSRYLNRELSWLEFNGRVLALAFDPEVALLERLKFCAIFSSNFDEFFEVRVAGIKDQIEANIDQRTLDGLKPRAQLAVIRAAVRELVGRHDALFTDELLPALDRAGISIVEWDELDVGDRVALREIFLNGVFPVLTPLAVDPGHPFPYISNLSLNLGATVVDPVTGDRRFARVKVPSLLPRFIALPDGLRFILLEELIRSQFESLFPGMEIANSYTFRVTRNADISLEEGEAEDLLAAVEIELRRRRFGRAVRLEVSSNTPDDIVGMLVDELELEPLDVSRVTGPIDLTGLWALVGLDRPELKDDPWKPRTPAILQEDSEGGIDIFARIRAGDIMVHHPYDSFSSSVERFIQTAATDPDVLSIKLTLYRTSGDSPVVKALIDAAERGKQVAALVELKARFDEQANIVWARKLEEAGVHVVYGLVGLKTHTKVALVVRSESDGLRRYCHVATGNYNSATARIYEDLGLFSARPALGDDLIKLFNGLTGFGRPVDYTHLVVAPTGMREKMIDLIINEMPTATRGPGRIVLKMNSLVDQPVIEALYEASQAGVQIDLLIRGICCLRPGVPGLSENIRVRSIVGRFLEHSRVWSFANGNGTDQPAYFIGSADLMPRNLDRRVEAIVPILDPALQDRLHDLLHTLLADNASAWCLDDNGEWQRVQKASPEEKTIRAHHVFQQLALERSGATVAGRMP